MPELSVCVPARNEEWLNLTVQDVLRNSSEQTEVIVVLDGAWPEQPLDQHPRVQVVYVPQAIGQRAATNLAARISTAPYVMKLDAHCSLLPGFDTVLLESAQELGRNVVQIPAQKNLHTYDWVCKACGRREYQCGLTECRACYSKDIHKEIVWQPRGGTRMTRWRFDSELHYQGWGHPKETYVETMTCLGACWFVARDYWFEIEGLDEDHGSWGQVGVELACKAWLSGGRMVTNTKTQFAHFFRVGGQKFPYDITGEEQAYARRYSQNLWRGNRWPKQIHPLRWMIDKFWPVPGWTEEQRDALPSQLSRDLRLVDVERRGADAVVAPVAGRSTKGVVHYSDCLPDARILAAARESIASAGLPIVSVTLKPSPWPAAQNIVLDLERGYLTMFKQILAGLEAIDTEIVFLCEHDVLYHPCHFQFTPEKRDVFYYNQHVFKVDAATGRTLHYRCSQTSGLCAHRELLVEHYRKRVSLVEERGFTRAMGFEPGTHNRAERVDDYTAETWMSRWPIVDIRHGQNLTASRWRKEEFRNQQYTEGWIEGDSVPWWGHTLGRFDRWLQEVTQRASQQAVA